LLQAWRRRRETETRGGGGGGDLNLFDILFVAAWGTTRSDLYLQLAKNWEADSREKGDSSEVSWSQETEKKTVG